MKRLTLRNHKVSGFLIGMILFASFALMLSVAGYYNFCYMEQGKTFIYHSTYLRSVPAQPGGCVQLAADFIMQFFLHPLAGILPTAFLLTAITLTMTRIMRSRAESRWLLPLSVLPAVSLLFLHYNTNYQYAGTVALLLMAVCISVQILFRKLIPRMAYSVASALLLFVMAGPIAFLYGWCVFLIELFRNFKQAFWFLLLPLSVYMAGKACLWMGMAGELRHVLLPDGYFTLRLRPGSVIYQPWIITAALCFMTGLSDKWMRVKSRRAQGVLAGLLCAGIAVFALHGAYKYIPRNNEAFKELDYYARHGRWDALIECCKHLPMSNLLFQNYLHMALAEEGRLADELFNQPCVDIRSIYVEGNKTPYVSAMLSDIYFSMGHMGFAQRYAFEANEGWGNFSPRMLFRLIETNLIYGRHETARKYIEVLEASLFYSMRAASYRRFLYNDTAIEADPVLGAKRKCLFPDNRFSGSKGLDDDLKQILLQNPSHRATILYLGSLYLLSKDLQRFKGMLETFYGTPALPPILPVCFQEGVAAFAARDRETLQRYNIEASTIQRYEAFGQQRSREPHSLWHFLKYRN